MVLREATAPDRSAEEEVDPTADPAAAAVAAAASPPEPTVRRSTMSIGTAAEAPVAVARSSRTRFCSNWTSSGAVAKIS